MPSEKIKHIIATIDKYLVAHSKEYFTAVEAAAILDRLGILKDSLSRRGLPLRNLLRAGELPHAYQIGKYWHIPHSGNLIEKTQPIIPRGNQEVISSPTKNQNTNNKLMPIAQAIASYLVQRFNKPANYALEYSPDWLTAVPDKDNLAQQWQTIKTVYSELVDKQYDLDDRLRLIKSIRKQYFDIWFHDPYYFAVEFDEEQHFNQFRAITLEHYQNFDCSINLSDYSSFCNVIKKTGSSGFQKLKSNDPLFPEMYQGDKQDNRIRQRAFRDFLKDIVPVTMEYCPTVRIPYHIVGKKKKGFNESDLQTIILYIENNNMIT